MMTYAFHWRPSITQANCSRQTVMRGGVAGDPTPVIYARKLTEEAILNGIRAGQVFIDLEGTPTRTLEFSANAGGTTASMGDS
jgi:hypothetical protein